MKNKIFSVLLVVLMLFSMSAYAKTFSDMNGHWSEPYVKKMTDVGFIGGFDDGTYRPDASVTRADALILSSRVLGSSEKALEEFNYAAYEKYGESIEKLGYKGYEKGFVHLVHNDVYSIEEITKFLEKDLGKNALKRYEAAILFVKLMGAEDEVLKNTMPILDYKDTNEIPASAQAYVEYCSHAGLMQGMGDNMFSPNTEVTRGQIAKILCSVIEALDITHVQGKVTGYDDKTKELTYKSDTDRDVTIKIAADHIVKRDGEDILDTSVIKKGDRVNVTARGDKIVMIEFVSEKPVTTIEGVFVKYIKEGETLKVEIKDSENATNIKTFEVAKDCKITYNGAECDFTAFTENCYIDYELKDEVIVSIAGKRNEIWREGVIEAFIYGEPSMLEISLEDGTKEKYEYDKDLKVWRDDAETTINDLYIGDKVVVGIYFNKIKFLTAKSVSESAVGEIKKIVISETEPAIVLSTETGDKAYDLSGKDLVITNKDKKITVYDLRLGYKVEATIVGNTVTKLNVLEATVTEEFTLTGTIVNVNTTYNNLMIQDKDGSYRVVFVNDKTVINRKTGEAVKFSDIKPGSTVISIVTPEKLNNVAISIVVISE